jgi:hypothetical protein
VEDQWLSWAKKLQAIASTGLHFAESDYDKERYVEIAEIAEVMLASLGRVPISEIRGLFPDFGKGYATPQVDVRGALLRGRRYYWCENVLMDCGPFREGMQILAFPRLKMWLRKCAKKPV